MGFDHIRGHERVLQVVSRIIVSDRLSHAYLFAGPDGIGKRLVAVAFAKTLLCSSGGTECCNRCASCVQVDSGNNPDLHIIEPDKTAIPIDSIRDLQQELSRTSFAGRYKVCIVDEAEKMTAAAQNALLKTLEEPSSETVLFLITGKQYRLLTTIRSRCQQLTFQPLAMKIAAALISDKAHVDEPTAHLLASLTGGSPGKALQVDISDIEEMRKQLLHHLSENQGKDLFFLAEDFSKDKELLDFRLNLARLWFRDLVHYKVYERTDGLVNSDSAEEIAVQSRLWRLDKLLETLFRIEEHSLSLESNVNPRLVTEALFSRLWPGEETG